jgi:8-oxo-dGTP pyrophosphatase MutT (NUDIX family)
VSATSDGPSQWRTFGEREIYRSPDLWFGQVDVEIYGGERIWQHVLRLHQVALMLLLDHQDRVLLVWRHRLVPERWGWELPGGAVDEGEQPGEAAVRELEDQTGFGAGPVEHLISFQALAGTADAEHAVFVRPDPKQIGEPTVMDEVARAEWVPLRSVPGLIASAQIWNAASLVALLQVLMLSAEPESH